MPVPHWLAALGLLLLSPQLSADALADLSARLAPLASLEGEFRQETRSAEGETLEVTEGRLKLLRPAWFAWHIQAPEEQLLIAAESSLWHYDVELETATRRSLDPDSPTNPLTILGGDIQALGEHYRVEQSGAESWRLVPRFESAEFAAVELSFEGDLPSRMTVRDALDRESLIRFRKLAVNPALSPADFEFVPPPGVDVYDSGS